MGLKRLSVSPSDYVVVDVETNGFRSGEHDLLSISLYKPDDGLEYDRFLPLDLNDAVYTTEVNGITKSKLEGRTHLTQEELDGLFESFELGSRTLLHYGNIDEKFIREYFKRQGLRGFERLRFYNFKRMVCSSKFSDGSLTKDRRCGAFGIDGVTEVHTGINDCKLEWRLFEAFGGNYILATMRAFHWQFSVLSPDYIIPVSYLSAIPNLSRLYERPYITYEAEEVFRLHVEGEHIRRFDSNFSGKPVEHLINIMVGAEVQDNREFLKKNSFKNKRIGEMEHDTRPSFMRLNQDGTVTAVSDRDKGRESEINACLLDMKTQMEPLIDFIKESVFNDGAIMSQELIVYRDLGIMAMCDLSSKDAVLEIKTTSLHPEDYAEQLYYEANGRLPYLLTMSWGYEEVDLAINLVDVRPGEKPNARRDKVIASLNGLLEKEGLEIAGYQSSAKPITIRCRACGRVWDESRNRIQNGKCFCSACSPEREGHGSQKVKSRGGGGGQRALPKGEMLCVRAKKYAEKVSARSADRLKVTVSSYMGSKEPVAVTCLSCGRTWYPRADHLLAKCYCPRCSRSR